MSPRNVIGNLFSRTSVMLAAAATVMLATAGTSKAGLEFTFNKANEIGGTGPFGTMTLSKAGAGILKVSFQIDTTMFPSGGFDQLGFNMSNSLTNAQKTLITTQAASANFSNASGWTFQGSGNMDGFGSFDLRFGNNSQATTYASGSFTISGLGTIVDDLNNFVRATTGPGGGDAIGNYAAGHLKTGWQETENPGSSFVTTKDLPQDRPEFEIPLPAGVSLMLSGMMSAGVGGFFLRRRRVLA